MKNHSLGASLLSVPLLSLKETVIDLSQSGIDFFHIDVMDANFVPNLAFSGDDYHSIGAIQPEALFDVHFMTTSKALDNILPSFLKPLPRWMTFHIEAEHSLDDLFQFCIEKNIQPGLAINPDTDLSLLTPWLAYCKIVLLMSVPPGYGGQLFRPETLPRLATLKKWKDDHNWDFLIEVDGGITLPIAYQLKALGADMIVIGSQLAKQDNKQEFINNFHFPKI